VRALSTEPARFQSWLDVEAALAGRRPSWAFIPEAAGHDIDRKAHVKYLDPGAVRRGWSASAPSAVWTTLPCQPRHLGELRGVIFATTRLHAQRRRAACAGCECWR
jgi:hypothetical protein